MQTRTKYETREQWLDALTDLLRPIFAERGITLPAKVRVSCGWPSRKALAPNGKSRTIGQCWPTVCSGDGHSELFISPCLGSAAEVGHVLVHELIHAVDDCANGHRGAFGKMARAIGLEGKLTATTAGAELAKLLEQLCAKLGAYPHARLDLAQANIKKQTTRLLKVVCPDPDCGYTVRTTAKWVEIGFPTCVCGE